MMLVLAIIGGLLAVGLPKMQGQKNKIKTIVRQLGSLSKEVRNLARLKRMTYRIAFQIEKPSKYWVEAAAGSVVVPSKSTLELLEKLDKEERPPNPFQKVDRPIKEKELPDGLVFKSIETISSDIIYEKGMAYIYYSPEGLVEKAVIQVMTDKQVIWSLVINPLTGHADMIEKPINLKETSIE